MIPNTVLHHSEKRSKRRKPNSYSLKRTQMPGSQIFNLGFVEQLTRMVYLRNNMDFDKGKRLK